jgi:hypothetical protein
MRRGLPARKSAAEKEPGGVIYLLRSSVGLLKDALRQNALWTRFQASGPVKFNFRSLMQNSLLVKAKNSGPPRQDRCSSIHCIVYGCLRWSKGVFSRKYEPPRIYPPPCLLPRQVFVSLILSVVLRASTAPAGQ